MKSLTVPFPYIGGKCRVSKQILSYMADHKIYVEPFFGSGGVFFKKGYKQVSSQENYREVIGDLDSNVTNFFEQLRNNYDEMMNKLQYLEYSEDLSKKAKTNSEYYINSNNIMKACLFFFNACSSFSGKVNHGFAYSKISRNNVYTFQNKIKNLKNYVDRLKQTFIFNKSYDVLIDRFDTEETLFYLDPPYLGCNKYAIQKKIPFNFDKFVTDVKAIKGKFILSYYKSDWLLDNFSDYNIIDIKHSPTCAGKLVNGKRHIKEGSDECIVLNYDPEKVNLWTGEEIKSKGDLFKL
ncbi:MAG: hypothetical protein GF364_12985 [Candidatus Lokiarchaeota archaeon]|nr:hypothetical protein [Candidatus Lokiarchaeota archaeon]